MAAEELSDGCRPITRRLANGLLLHHYHRLSDVVGLGLGISVGGRHDPPDQEGLAHVVEHLLFRGSRHWSEKRLDIERERRVAQWSGNTSPERTFYWIALPAGELEFGLKYLRQLVFEPVFPEKSLDEEKGKIDQEALWIGVGRDWQQWLGRLMLDWSISPDQIIESLRHHLLKDSGLEKSLIGFSRKRKKISMQDVKEFHRQHYTADRTAVLVVGGMESERLSQQVERHLGDLKPARQPFALTPAPALRRHPGRRALIRQPGKTMQSFGVGHAVTNLTSADIPIWHLLRKIIAMELQERIPPSEITFRGYITNVEYRHSCLLMLALHGHQTNAQKLEQATLEVLDKLGAGEIDLSRFEREREELKNYWIMRLENARHYVGWLAEDPSIFSESPPPAIALATEQITLDALRHLARRTLDPANRLVLTSQPTWIWLPATLLFIFGLLVGVGYSAGYLVSSAFQLLSWILQEVPLIGAITFVVIILAVFIQRLRTALIKMYAWIIDMLVWVIEPFAKVIRSFFSR